MLKLKILDARNLLKDSEILQLLDDIGSGKEWQVQVYCGHQELANMIRSRIFNLTIDDGRQFEITILGSGAAVGVKKFLPPVYIWDAENKKEVLRTEWEKTHA